MQIRNYFGIIMSALLILSTSADAYQIPNNATPKFSNPDVSALQKVSSGISTIAQHSKKGIVFVSISKVVRGQPFGLINPFDFFFGPGQQAPNGNNHRRPPEYKQKGLGSGFIIDLKKGYILTNNHVIADADEINLKLANGETYEAKVVGRDKNTDIAVVQIKGSFKKAGLVQLGLGSSDKVNVGNLCIALGAPFGLEASVSLGVVSAIGRGSLSITELGNFIQTDAAINPGNSGGPLLDVSGNVIGINTAIYSKSGGYNGIGFAIPASLVRNVANQLINDGKVERGYLGVMLSEMDPELSSELNIPKGYRGALIRSVEPNSPADKANVEAGDVVIEIERKKIESVQHLRNVVGLHKPGKKVILKVIRDGKQKNLTVKLGNYNSSDMVTKTPGQRSGFGLSLANLNAKYRKQFKSKSSIGAVILDVIQNSSADRAGLQEGDVIVKVNNKRVDSARIFWKLAKGRDRLLVRIERAGQFLFVPLRR